MKAQTDFAPGEIMFVGYESDEMDTFSIVLLKDVLSGTVIYITDRGWSNSGAGFRTGTATAEGVINLTFNANYTCGKEIIFGKNTAPNPDVWEAKDVTGASMGTVSVIAGTNGGPDLDPTNGDQLFIYQLPVPIPTNQSSFVTAIHMDGGCASSGDIYWHPYS